MFRFELEFIFFWIPQELPDLSLALISVMNEACIQHLRFLQLLIITLTNKSPLPLVI